MGMLFTDYQNRLKEFADSFYGEKNGKKEEKRVCVLLLMEIGNIEYQFSKNIKVIRVEMLEKISNIPKDVSGCLQKIENPLFECLAANFGSNPSPARLMEFASFGFIGCCLNPLDETMGYEGIDKFITEDKTDELLGKKEMLDKCYCNLEKICQLLIEKVSEVTDIIKENNGVADFNELSEKDQKCIESIERLIAFLYEMCYIQLIVDSHGKEQKEFNIRKINEVVTNSKVLISSIKENER